MLTFARIARCAFMLAIIAASASAASAQQKRDEVTFALNWLPVGEAAGWYVALDKGYFKENNIDVNIVRGFGSGDTAKRVAAKRAQFGVADIGTVILCVSTKASRSALSGCSSAARRTPYFSVRAQASKLQRTLRAKVLLALRRVPTRLCSRRSLRWPRSMPARSSGRLRDSAVAIATFAAGRADVVRDSSQSSECCGAVA